MDNVLDLIEQGKIKRTFRAREKFSYPEACCHITQRAPGREMLFLEEADYLSMLRLLKEKSQRFDFELYSFSLMPNHVHLQIKLKKDNLAIAMKSIFENYARSFNRKYERKGHVFCGPYRQALCLDDSYVLAVSIYIHLNAVRAGLVVRPWEYRWSSCNLYVLSTQKQSFVNEKFILETLNKDMQQALKIYQKLLVEASTIKTEEVWERSDVLDLFKARLFKTVPDLVELWKKVLKEQKDVLKEGLLNDRIEELKKKERLRSPQELQARKYLIEQLIARGFSVAQIAEKFNISRQGIYNSLNLTK
jgi:putative transposase